LIFYWLRQWELGGDWKLHAVKEQLPGVQYCINSPPPLALVFSFSNYSILLLTIIKKIFLLYQPTNVK